VNDVLMKTAAALLAIAMSRSSPRDSDGRPFPLLHMQDADTAPSGA